jgi:hypothetical protein
MRWRLLVDVTVVVLLAGLVASRVVTISHSPRLRTDARVAQLMLNRTLANQVIDYARKYQRPAFFLDSVQAHLDSGAAASFARLQTDLWGDPVGYFWQYCWFMLFSDAGHRGLRPGMDDRFLPFRPNGAALDEVYHWPRELTRAHGCPEAS